MNHDRLCPAYSRMGNPCWCRIIHEVRLDERRQLCDNLCQPGCQFCDDTRDTLAGARIASWDIREQRDGMFAIVSPQGQTEAYTTSMKAAIDLVDAWTR